MRIQYWYSSLWDAGVGLNYIFLQGRYVVRILKNILCIHSICCLLFPKALWCIMTMHIFSLIPVKPLTPAVLQQYQPLSYVPYECHEVVPVCLPHYTAWFCMFQFCAGLDATVPSLGGSALSLEFTFSCVCSATSSLEGNSQARAAPAVPSPLWREKHRNVAQMKAQQPVKVVRTYRGTKAKFRN